MTKELQICSYRDFLHNYLFKKFPRARREDVEDAVQNALIKAVRFADKWQGGSSLKTWLAVITVNMYLDTFRKTYSKIEYILDDELKTLLADKIPEGCKCFVVLDCCHSGTGIDLKYKINAIYRF